MSRRTPAQADLAALERHAMDLLRQCTWHRLHTMDGKEDGARTVSMRFYAEKAAKVAGRMARRWEKGKAKREAGEGSG